jgi:cytosine/adenosine deaminase-related metal-dependent hydrolase
VSAETLFAAAQQRGMRLIAGKVLMDRHAPDGLRDDVAQAERDCIDLIDRWHGTDRLAYAVTVRFAPTSTPEQLAMAGALCAADPSLYMQTHVAENRAEVQWVRELFPQARSYLDVYARAGLLHARSVLAHGIWLDADDRAALHDSGAQIAHSPSSNLFLGSGLFDWRAAEAAPTRFRPWPDSASPRGRASTPPHAGRRGHSGWTPRSARSTPAVWPMCVCGTGPQARSRRRGWTWRAVCMNVCSRG